MKYNYNMEVNNILTNIYKEIIFKLAISNPEIDFSNDKISDTKKLLSNEKIYIGSDMDEFIISNIPKGPDGNLFRVSISKFHNRLHPRFENYKGEPIVDSSYSKFALLLWEEHMNNLLIDDIQNLFTQHGFVDFVNNELDKYKNELIQLINNYKNNLISINFKNKEELLNIISDMIVNKELSFDYAHILVDMDKLRDDMIKLATTFDVYNEFDKLEDDTKYCLINYCKYDADSLINELVKNHDFKLINNNSLVKCK